MKNDTGKVRQTEHAQDKPTYAKYISTMKKEIIHKSELLNDVKLFDAYEEKDSLSSNKRSHLNLTWRKKID